MDQEEEITLEEAFAKLEQTIVKLEEPEAALEDSFLAYQKGMELLQYCNSKIDSVEKKVLLIDESGNLNEF